MKQFLVFLSVFALSAVTSESTAGPEAVTQASGAGSVTLIVLMDITASQLTCDVKLLPEPRVITAGRGLPRTSEVRGLMSGWGRFAIDGFQTGDRVMVGSLGRHLRLSGRFTSDKREINDDWNALFDVPPVEGLGPSQIWDGVNDAIEPLAREPRPRAIVLITDGMASGNVHSQKEVAVKAAEASVSVSVMALEPMLPTYPLTTMASHGIDPAQALWTLADTTGGVFELVRGEVGDPYARCFTRNPAPVFRRTLDRLHQAYERGNFRLVTKER